MKNLQLAGSAAALLISASTLTACSGTGQEESSGGGDAGADLTFAVVTHASPGDAFWDRVQSGAEAAGEQYGVDVQYSNDPDPAKQSQLIDAAVADEADGIVVSMANPDGLQTSVEAAVEAGVPVITINSGGDQSADFGAITHIGQSETVAGEAVGARMADEGLSKAICVIQEAGNVGLEERCAAAADAFGGEMENLQVDGTDDNAVTATITSQLQADPGIDAVLTLGGQQAVDAVAAVDQAGSDAQVATFDLSDDVLAGIEDGSILFAVDQQPYVQGFMGVSGLYLKSTNGNDIGGGQPINSGPAFVTAENAAEVAEFSANGTR